MKLLHAGQALLESPDGKEEQLILITTNKSSREGTENSSNQGSGMEGVGKAGITHSRWASRDKIEHVLFYRGKPTISQHRTIIV